MSDFSFFSLFTAGLALFAPLADAYTKPVGDAPKGNPITQPGFMSVVPAGKPFTVTWEPTTDGTVSLVLLKGPSENAVPQYAIAEKIENDGTFDWTPKKDLEPTEGAEGYGIQLIVDKTGQYQYTTQFGISNPNYEESDKSSSSSEAAPSSTGSAGGYGDHGRGNWNGHGNNNGHGHGGWGHGGHNVHGGYTHPAAGSASASATGSSASGLSSSYTHKGSNNGTVTGGGHAKPTGYMNQNVTMTQVKPTGGYTSRSPVQSSPASTAGYGASASASGSGAPQATDNGAAAMVSSFGGLVLAAGAAVFAL